MGAALFSIIVFPGFLFLGVLGFAVEFADRKLYARFQNRMGPPWYQPLADFIKLSAKEDIIPEQASRSMFVLMPIIAATAVITAFLYIPLWQPESLFSFSGDLVVVLYLLTIPSVCFFLGGWYSTSLFATIGAVRGLTQLFAYEVPLFLALLSPAVLAGTWSLKEIAVFYTVHPWLVFANIAAFLVSLIALQGKLERVPFDIPEAETEIVGGSFTEYTGRLLALFRMAIDMELVAGCSLVAAVFLPWGITIGGFVGLLLYLVKVFFVLFLLALMRSIMARIRIEQMIDFCWKYVAPIALLQLLFSVYLSGMVLR